MFSTLPLGGFKRGGSDIFCVNDSRNVESLNHQRRPTFSRQSRESSTCSLPGPGTYDVSNDLVSSQKKLTPRATIDRAKRITSDNFLIAKDSPGSGFYSSFHDRLTIGKSSEAKYSGVKTTFAGRAKVKPSSTPGPSDYKNV